MDLRSLISAADLVYDKPVPRSEEGMPIGNGRMGTLVWTTPRIAAHADQSRGRVRQQQLHQQLLRTAQRLLRRLRLRRYRFREARSSRSRASRSASRSTTALLKRSAAQSMSGLAGAGCDGGARDDRRPCRSNPAHAARGEQVLRRATGDRWCATTSSPCRLAITRRHRASRFAANAIVLTQEFREGEYCCKSAVAIGMGTAGKGRPRILNETEARLEAPARHGSDRERRHASTRKEDVAAVGVPATGSGRGQGLPGARARRPGTGGTSSGRAATWRCTVPTAWPIMWSRTTTTSCT